MTGRDVNGRDGLSGQRQGGRRPASRPVRAATGDSRAASKRHMPREPATSAMRQQRPAQGTCPSPEQTPSSSRWRAWHSGCQLAPAIRRPEVETFRSARRTGAICGYPPYLHPLVTASVRFGVSAVMVTLVWGCLSLLPVPDSCRVLRAGGRVTGARSARAAAPQAPLT